MTIPRNKRRTIVVDGIEYEYCVKRFISIYIKNLTTKEEYSWWQDVKPKWGYSFKPSDVKELIRNGEINGIGWRKL